MGLDLTIQKPEIRNRVTKQNPTLALARQTRQGFPCPHDPSFLPFDFPPPSTKPAGALPKNYLTCHGTPFRLLFSLD
jgi:hypothetical protein